MARLQAPPNRSDEMVARGLALQRAGKVREAEACYTAVLRQNPAHAEANNAMGTLAIEMQRLEPAIQLFQRALAARPKDPQYLNNMGLTLNLAERPEDALPFIEAGLRLAPNAYELLCNIGRSLEKLGRASEATPYLRKAVKQHPDRVEAMLLLADALIGAGETGEAETLYRRVLKLAEGHRGALYGLARAKKQTATGNVLDEIDRALSLNDTNDVAKSVLHYAAAKTYIDLGDPENTFAHLAAAKQLQPRRLDRQQQSSRLSRLKSLFNPQFLRARAALGVDDRAPVFIVGLPRSGTSLTEQILSSHPEVHGAGELGYVHAIANKLMFSLPTLDLYAEQVVKLDKARIREFANFYLRKTRSLSPAATIITDKMPHNFMHLGLIALLLPKARIIHCRRDPLDNCFSIYSNHFNDRHAYAHDLADLGWYYRQYAGLMEHWQATMPDMILDFQYEELVGDLEGQTRRMLDFVGLPFDEACLNFEENRRGVSTLSRAQVREPLYTSSIGRWRPYEKQLGPLIEALAG